ncbi:iron-containing alcohol dehydrogenase [Nesterenkonia halobia]|uniref:Alcohol dehydrogenase iron-type/glycerol dehydrogenase GldA domain-containing protein n=1 Tax=Nesterenkonia halobia TaxID=37922 RepID=A0ABP6RB88_9MICC
MRGPAPNQITGTGALQAATTQSAASHPVLFIDSSVVEAANSVLSRCTGIQPAARIVVSGPIDWDAVEAFASTVVESGADSLIALGGGNTMDAAKLAGWCAATPGGANALRARSRVGGLVMGARDSISLPLLCVPSTVGTGAEVSAVACCETTLDDDTYKCLVSFEGSPVSAAVYEPEVLNVPASLLHAGIAEAWLRVLGAFVGAESTIAAADDEALALIRRMATFAEQALECPRSGSPGVLDVALTSATNHTGWALQGRGMAPSPLWFVANELSMLVSVTKMEAMAALVGGWLTQVVTVGSEWGDQERLTRALQASGDITIDQIVDRMQRLVGGAVPPFSAAQLADRVIARFGGGRPLPRRHTAEKIAHMAKDAALFQARDAHAAR